MIRALCFGLSSNDFSKDELSFVKDPPDLIQIDCPICLHIINDPHLTSCGHHFCGPCIKQVKDDDGACPVCKEKNYQIFSDKNLLRIIKGLQVYCTNKDSGCEWSGELKDLGDHINKRLRYGECQYEEVKCRYYHNRFSFLFFESEDRKEDFCMKKAKRHILKKHETDECPRRPYTCQYCGHKATYSNITQVHCNTCTKYPVSCTNKCGETFQRDTLRSHLDKECPLQPVECQFKWAGCNETPLRKDLQGHIGFTMMSHFTLLAVACGELKKENKDLKKENEEMRKEIDALKKTNKE